MFVWPHGIHVDREGNVWVTDARAPKADEINKFPGQDKKRTSVEITKSEDDSVSGHGVRCLEFYLRRLGQNHVAIQRQGPASFD